MSSQFSSRRFKIEKSEPGKFQQLRKLTYDLIKKRKRKKSFLNIGTKNIDE